MKIYKISDDGLSESTFKDSQADLEGKYWIILKPDELVEKLSSFRFNYHTIYDCLHDEDTPRIEIYDNYSFGILNILGESDDFFAPCELDFYITAHYLIFIAHTELKIISAVMNDLKTRGALKLSTERILYVMLDKLTLKDYRVLENIELEIANVEDDVIEGKTKNYIEDIVSLKKRLLFLKRHYEPLLDIAESLYQNENSLLDKKSLAFFKILFNRIDRLNSNVSNLRDYVTQVRESYQAQVDINLNNVMKLFTIITVIFSPLSFIAGWYGMNFQRMPELNWVYGYPAAAVLCVATVIICLIFFKRKKLM